MENVQSKVNNISNTNIKETITRYPWLLPEDFLVKLEQQLDQFSLSSSKQNIDLFARAKQSIYPSFFSEKGLAQDILELTQAEPDIPLNAFITLNKLKHYEVLKDTWTSFLGASSIKGILHSPENLMGDQDVFQLPNRLPQEKESIFMRFQQVINGIDALERKVFAEDICQEESILKSLREVKAFYNDYKEQVLNFCQVINEKKSFGRNTEDDFAQFSRFLKPKAIIFCELFSKGLGYRISRDTARHILSLKSDGAPIEKDRNSSSNHSVSFLPDSRSEARPRVFFKANGLPSLQPGKETMLYSLYRLLNIPIPQTGLLVITNVNQDSTFYVAQASEAVNGESLKADISPLEKLEVHGNDLLSFCKQAIGAILTNPSDGKPANFVYHKEKYGLVSVDNDEVFHQEFSATSNNDDYFLKTKSLLLCLQAMNSSIPRSLSVFLSGLDPQLILLAWLDELKQKNEEYKYLESVLRFENARQAFQKIPPRQSSCSVDILLKQKIDFYDLNEGFWVSLSLPILVSKKLLDSLQKKLSQIFKAVADNFMITPQELLERTSPYLGAYYKTLRSKFPNHIESIVAIFSKGISNIDYSLLSSFPAISSLNSPSETEESNCRSQILPEILFRFHRQAFRESNLYPFDKILEKYGEKHKNGLYNPEEALREILYLVHFKLTAFKSAKNVVDFWYKGRTHLAGNSFLAEHWDALFFSLQNPELKWLFSLEKHFPRGWEKTTGRYPQNVSDIKGAFMGKRSLSQSILNQILDQNGTFKKEPNLPGRSQVTRFPSENPLFYFKKSPEIAGYEYAVTLFMRLLGLENIPFSELLLLYDPRHGLYPVLLSQAVAGDTIDQIWQDDRKFASLDHHQICLLILTSFLLNPEDGKGDNYILTSNQQIIPIDNDHTFLPGITQETLNGTTKRILQNKTILYCLHEMGKPVPSKVAKSFIDLDIDRLLQDWMAKLIIVNECYQNLPPENILIEESERGTFFRIPIDGDYLIELYTKFHLLQKTLKSQQNSTPLSLLGLLEPEVGKLYSEAFQQEPTVIRRFMKLTNLIYKKDRDSRQISKNDSVQIFKLLKISTTELIGKDFLCKMGPYSSREILLECEKHKDKIDQILDKFYSPKRCNESQSSFQIKPTEQTEQTKQDEVGPLGILLGVVLVIGTVLSIFSSDSKKDDDKTSNKRH